MLWLPVFRASRRVNGFKTHFNIAATFCVAVFLHTFSASTLRKSNRKIQTGIRGKWRLEEKKELPSGSRLRIKREKRDARSRKGESNNLVRYGGYIADRCMYAYTYMVLSTHAIYFLPCLCPLCPAAYPSYAHIILHFLFTPYKLAEN